MIHRPDGLDARRIQPCLGGEQFGFAVDRERKMVGELRCLRIIRALATVAQIKESEISAFPIITLWLPATMK